MTAFEELVEYDWAIFIAHVCKYYKVPRSIIDEYKEELRWHEMSMNLNLDWSQELISSYKEYWYWPHLGNNDAIEWDPSHLKTYRGYLDVLYLGRCRQFYVDDAFFSGRLTKNFRLVWDNKYFTKELQEKYPDRVFQWTKPEEELLTEEEACEKVLKKYSSIHKQFYKFKIEPFLDDQKLKEIMEAKFSIEQKYYRVSIKEDLIINYGFNNDDNEFAWTEESYFTQDPNKVHKVRGNHVTGKKMIPEYIEIDRVKNIYLLSEHFCDLLSHFSLPPHEFYQANVKHDRLTTDTQFKILRFEKSVKTRENVDYTRANVVSRISNNGKNLQYVLINDEVNTVKDYYAVEYRAPEGYNRKDTKIVNHPLLTGYDMYAHGIELVVNEFVREAMERIFPGHFRFLSYGHYEISIDQDLYEAKKAKYNDVDWESFGIGNTKFEIDKQFIAWRKKAKRLKKEPAIIPESEFSKDNYKVIEQKLNVIIPQTVKQAIIALADDEEYELLTLDAFFIENEYANDQPQSVNAMIVAENGVGDSLGFILEEDCDYTLSPIVNEFLHEEGGVEIYERN